MQFGELANLVVLVLGFSVGLWQVRLLRIQIRDDHELRRRSEALRYSFSEDPEMRKIRNELARKLDLFERGDGEISLETIKSLQSENPDIRAEIQYVLGRLEAMCISIKYGVISEDVCKDLMRGSVRRYFRQFRQYIEDVRIVSKNDKIYENLEFYARRWDDSVKPLIIHPITGKV